MSYLVLARKWRPQTFEEVVGQEPTVRTLSNALSEGRLSHAYLFSGPRGVGKTSMARILAKALNCEKGPTAAPCNSCSICSDITDGSDMDVLEIDGASNRRIDEARELRSNVKFATARDRFKVYIIDEVHMLTTEAFNALLKTLEEPPEHVKFIFATTEPHKVPITILSRCQRFDFRRISAVDIVKRLKAIAADEKLKADEEALFAIARAASGSMRDAESILDQLIAYAGKEITPESVEAALGSVSGELLMQVVEAVGDGDAVTALRLVDQVVREGKDVVQLVGDLGAMFRDMMVLQVGGAAAGLVELPAATLERLGKAGQEFSGEQLVEVLDGLTRLHGTIKRSETPRVQLELAVMKLVRGAGGGKDDGKPLQAAPKPVRAAAPGKVKEEKPARGKKAAPAAPGTAGDTGKSVRKAAAEEPAAEAEAGMTLEEVQSRWIEVVNAVKAGKRTVAAYLVEGWPVGVSGTVITIGFPKKYKFQKDGVERPDARQLIEAVLGKVFQRSFVYRCVSSEVKLPKTKREGPPPPEHAPEPDKAEPQVDDKSVETALKVMGGRVVKGKGRRR